MKKYILKIAAICLVSTALLPSCSTHEEKVEKAQENALESKKDFDRAQEEYLLDVEKYKIETDKQIDENERQIAEFKLKIKHNKKQAKEAYNKRIEELKQRNREMKKKIDGYKANGKENWEQFKTDFRNGMDDIAMSLKDLTAED